MEKYPATASASAAAVRSWRNEFEGLIADLDRRMEAIARGSGRDPAQLEAKKEQLSRGALAKFDEGMSSAPAVKQQEDCERLPVKFAQGHFDLELMFASELKIIRAHPPDVERPTQQ